MGEKGFGNLERRQQKLNQKKDVLVTLNTIIPWESFRAVLESVREKPRKSNAGRKPFDAVLLFKLMLLQQLYNISDEELEYQVNDRLSFMQFLGLSLEDPVPDATTLWLFRQQLTDSGKVTELFEQFESYLRTQGYSAQGGQIVYKFGGLPWSDAGFSIHLIEKENRNLPELVTSESRLALYVYLVDASSTNLLVMRSVTLSPSFSAAFLKAIKEQEAEKWAGEQAYRAACQQIYEQYSPNDLVKISIAQSKGGA